MDAVKLFLHPVRLRIVHAMSSGQAQTTSELCTRLPDIPQATMYRQVATLLDGGALEIVDERRVGSFLERRYRLREVNTFIAPDRTSSMSTDEHRRLFGAAIATLLVEVHSYLDRDDSSASDQISYPQTTLWLDPGQFAELVAEIRDAIRARTTNGPAPNRSAYLISSILVPSGPPVNTPDVDG